MDSVVSMSGNAKPTLRLRTEKFDELAAAVTGARTDRELADKLGVGYNHLSQIRNHGRTPGAQFIAAVRSAMPHVPFEQLFETVEPVGAEDAA
jgi:transcriptional regulator with XRE-family HTH domain